MDGGLDGQFDTRIPKFDGGDRRGRGNCARGSLAREDISSWITRWVAYHRC